jgi:hypothetical protein
MSTSEAEVEALRTAKASLESAMVRAFNSQFHTL